MHNLFAGKEVCDGEFTGLCGNVPFVAIGREQSGRERILWRLVCDMSDGVACLSLFSSLSASSRFFFALFLP